ncbi:MAG: diacylglycerol kinase family protein [Planctomycetaceae bacterium]
MIWNPSAGQTAGGAEVRAQLEQRPGCRVLETQSRDEAVRVIRQGVESGCRRVVAAGGDGSVNLVVETLAELKSPDVSMAVLPMGTGNDLARSLGMPLDVTRSIQPAFGPADGYLDVFRCTSGSKSRVITNMCTSGNTGQYLKQLTPETKQLWGPFSYLRGVLDVVADMRVFEVEVRLDDGPAETYEVLNLFLANGRMTGGGMTVADNARFDDGRLELVMILDGTAGEIMSLTADYVFSDFLQNPLVINRSVRTVSVRATGPYPITVYGDVFTEEPFTVTPDDFRIPVVAPALRPGFGEDANGI